MTDTTAFLADAHIQPRQTMTNPDNGHFRPRQGVYRMLGLYSVISIEVRLTKERTLDDDGRSWSSGSNNYQVNE